MDESLFLPDVDPEQPHSGYVKPIFENMEERTLAKPPVP
jgi:hypothetical protein